MYLAVSLRDYPNDVRVDLQRYFGLNLDLMGNEYSVLHGAVCLSALPIGSALIARHDQKMALTLSDLPVLSLLEALSEKDNADNQLNGISLPLDEFKARLNQQWKDI